MLPSFKIFGPAVRFGCIISLSILSSIQAQPTLKPNLDVAQFQDKTHKPYLEIYYSLPEAAVQYAPDNGAYKCQLLLSLQIYQEQTLWASKVWKIEKTLADTAQLRSSQHLVDALSYLIDRPGRYRMVLHVKDAARVDSASAEFEVRPFSPEKLEVSDLELATALKTSSATSAAVFVKNGQEVIPNASTLFGEGAPELYYYFEAYHLTKNVAGRKYKTLCRIQTAEGKIVEGMGSAYRTKMKRFDSSVEMGMLNIAQLPSGKYRLVYGIADSTETLLASRAKDFFIYNPTVAANGTHAENEASTPNAGPLNALDEKALDDEFARMQYLATSNEKKFYKNLSNPEAKREYIFSLWKAAPANDGLAPLAYRQQYLARAQHAEVLYKSPNRPGWKTDRGRVFILYGPPQSIERFPSGTTTTLPYEIWTYHNLKGQGGVMFIFADRTGFSNYEQIHSDLQGELQDPNWQQLITRGSSSENRVIGVQ